MNKENSYNSNDRVSFDLWIVQTIVMLVYNVIEICYSVCYVDENECFMMCQFQIVNWVTIIFHIKSCIITSDFFSLSKPNTTKIKLYHPWQDKKRFLIYKRISTFTKMYHQCGWLVKDLVSVFHKGISYEQSQTYLVCCTHMLVTCLLFFKPWWFFYHFQGLIIKNHGF